MKKMSLIVSLACSAAVLLPFAGRAEISTNGLVRVPTEDLPRFGTFRWAKASFPPLPCPPGDLDVPIYALPNGQFLIDDTAVDYDARREAMMAMTGSLSEPQAAISYPTNACFSWDLDIGGEVYNHPAVGVDGTIYLPIIGGTLMAVATNMDVKWSTNTAQWGYVSSLMLSGADGILYGMQNGDILRAFNSTNGETLWSFYLSGSPFTYYGLWSSPALGRDGTVYVGYRDRVYAITNNGTSAGLKWAYTNVSIDFQYSSPVIGADETIYVQTSKNDKLFAFTPSGSIKWVTDIPDSRGAYGGSTSPAIGPDGNIYIGDGFEFYAVNPSGTRLWTNLPSIGEYKMAPVVGADGTVYVLRTWTTNYLQAISRYGTNRWEIAFASGSGGYNPSVKGSACVVASDGEIYFADFDGMVYSLAPDGTTNWSYSTGSSSLEAPMIAPDGTLYIFSYADRHLFAFCPGPTLACSVWPEYRKNGRCTAASIPGTLARVGLPTMRTNGFQFTVYGATNVPTCICASTDLTTWTNVGQIVLPGGSTNFVSTNFVDTAATNLPLRFYLQRPQ